MPAICSRRSQSNSTCSLPKRSAERLPTFYPFSKFATQPADVPLLLAAGYGHSGAGLIPHKELLQAPQLGL